MTTYNNLIIPTHLGDIFEDGVLNGIPRGLKSNMDLITLIDEGNLVDGYIILSILLG
jgi:hypothetical protein